VSEEMREREREGSGEGTAIMESAESLAARGSRLAALPASRLTLTLTFHTSDTHTFHSSHLVLWRFVGHPASRFTALHASVLPLGLYLVSPSSNSSSA
jgi:hypothetical protein